MAVDHSLYAQMQAPIPKADALRATSPLHLSIWPYAALALTAVYVIVEVAYNIGLVRMLSSIGPTQQTFRGMEVIGKALAAFGVSLATVRLFPVWRIRAFIVVAPILYFSFGAVIDDTIESLPQPVKVAGYNLGLQRAAVLNGELSDPELGPKSRLSPDAKRIATANIALRTIGDRQAVSRKVREYANRRFARDVGSAFSEADFDALWNEYSRVSEKLWPIWLSVRGQRIVSPFSPHLGKTLEDNEQGRLLFLQSLKHRDVAAYRQTVIYRGNDEYKIPPLRAGDFAPFMSRAELRAQVDRFVSDARETVLREVAPTENNIGSNRHADDFSASVFVPPISMTLSLVSIIANVASLLAGAVTLAGSFALRGRLRGWMATALHLIAMVVAAVALTLPLSHLASPFARGTEFDRLLSQCARSDNLAYKAWSYAIRAEATMYSAATKIPLVTSLADSLPAIGQRFADDRGSTGATRR